MFAWVAPYPRRFFQDYQNKGDMRGAVRPAEPSGIQEPHNNVKGKGLEIANLREEKSAGVAWRAGA